MPFGTNLKAELSPSRARGVSLERPVNGSLPNTCFQRDSFQEKFFVLIGPVESVHTCHFTLVGRRGVVGMNSAPISGCVGTACGQISAVHRASQFIPRYALLSTWLSTGVNQWTEVQEIVLGQTSRRIRITETCNRGGPEFGPAPVCTELCGVQPSAATS